MTVASLAPVRQTGKLAALLARRTSRDLFDTHELLYRFPLDAEKLRLAFVLYGAMNIEDWRTIEVTDIVRAAQDLDSYLLPLLRSGVVERMGEPRSSWGDRLVSECQEALTVILPLKDNETTFLNRLLADGVIEPEHLNVDQELANRVRRHPALLWKQINVRKHFGLDKPT